MSFVTEKNGFVKHPQLHEALDLSEGLGEGEGQIIFFACSLSPLLPFFFSLYHFVLIDGGRGHLAPMTFLSIALTLLFIALTFLSIALTFYP